jgi:hypothetical protein
MEFKPGTGGVFASFADVLSSDRYAALPDTAWLGLTDVVSSTDAIARGRAKAVNMAGAAAISAVMNALGGKAFPFAFGGDGAVIAVAASDLDNVRDALARTAGWCRDELALELRAALVPMTDIRASGFNVRIADYAPSANVRYAMFAGGGVRWAERAMKQGRYAIAPASSDKRPNLEGLSCRWQPVKPDDGLVLSLILEPGPHHDGFEAVVRRIISRFEADARAAHPVPLGGPKFGTPFAGFDLERRTRSSRINRFWAVARLFAWRTFAWFVVATNVRVAGFKADHYRRTTMQNSDYRKFQDGLHMTVGCTHATADAVEAELAAEQNAGSILFGLCRQDSALMTCIVPDYAADDHFHFLDGGAGGYAAAAQMLKAARSDEEGPPCPDIS